MEADRDVGGEWHGRDGPMPIHRPAPDELSALQRAFLDAATAAGHALVADHNTPGAVGVGPAPRNVCDGLRMSTALVVDSRGAVHGLRGLWVADASVMPTIPSANTHLSTIVVAERIAAWLAAD